MERIIRELEQVLEKGQMLLNEPMDRHTTFRVGGPADYYRMPTAETLPKTISLLKEYQIPVTVIGNGSNLLVSDAGIRGAVVEIGRRMSDISVEGETITARAGAMLSQVAVKAYKNGLSGMEFAAGIPGSVGGAVVMNAGAYGGEIKDILVFADVLDKDGEIKTFTNEQLEFGYRQSIISKQNYVAVCAKLRLHKAEPQAVKKKMEDLKERRISKQPLEFPSAGSAFKRPEGYFAGKLIMDAGLSGFSIGGAKVSEKHCGFVINQGGASASDIYAVICHVQKTVKEQFGVKLQTEVKLIGEF